MARLTLPLQIHMSCHGSHNWRVTIYTQDHSKTSSMQAIPTQEILPEIQQPDWTLGRQRLGNWQISGNHPMASTKENKAWKRTRGDKEHCMGIQASQSGDNIHVSIYPLWSTPLGLIAAWDQPAFCRCNEFLSQFVTLRVPNLALRSSHPLG